ncbi:MAG: nuclear transport factor 2 family protein [Hyphomonadaceae bacterium]
MKTPGDLLAEWAARFAADVTTLPALYTEDALFFGSTPPLHRGVAGISAYFAALPAQPGAAVAFSDVVIETIAEGVASIAAFATFTRGDTARRLRITLTAVRRGGAWRFASHHVSPA